MKISIENFKSIKKVQQFELKPFTVLSGVNSSGKSSFVQLLLLLKQSLELSSDKKVMSEIGEYYSCNELSDVFYEKNNENKISFGMTFKQSEFVNIDFPEVGAKEEYEVELLIDFRQNGKKIIVSDFVVNINAPDVKKKNVLELHLQENELYNIESDSDLYGKGLMVLRKFISPIDFVAFFPLSYEDPGGEKKLFAFDWLKKAINIFFDSISYIGPARIEPQEEYLISKSDSDVGRSGKFTAQILKDQSKVSVSYRILDESNNDIKYISAQKDLLSAVKYWMCDIFGVAEDIYSEKDEDVYRIFLKTKDGIRVNIKHVGFGISQLLPIVVQGLIMKRESTLIVEQPEVHLHPKVQSLLYDFLYSLTLDGKKVVVETHSSHFITRMRRRIAETKDDGMDDRINLTFIENHLFRTLEMDDYGTILNYYPKDFIEMPNEELKAIVEAQMNKRARHV
jgi:predicted ATPase